MMAGVGMMMKTVDVFLKRAPDARMKWRVFMIERMEVLEKIKDMPPGKDRDGKVTKFCDDLFERGDPTPTPTADA